MQGLPVMVLVSSGTYKNGLRQTQDGSILRVAKPVGSSRTAGRIGAAAWLSRSKACRKPWDLPDSSALDQLQSMGSLAFDLIIDASATRYEHALTVSDSRVF